MFETLHGLVSIYSPSGQEQAATAWLAERMQALGFQARIDSAGNAVGSLGSGPKQIVLLGHIDTVPGEIPVRIAEDVLYGRGSVDAKGPLACFVDAAARLGAVEGWQVVVIGAVGEETDSKGARFAAGEHHPDYAIIGEPNRWERVSLGYKGSAWAELTLRCEQAHSASGAPTASELAVELWRAIQQHADTYNQPKTRAFDKILPTLHGLESGQDAFSQWARLRINTRLPVETEPEQWYTLLEGIAAGAEVTRLGYAVPAWSCEKNGAPVRALLQGIRSQGGTPSYVYKTGTADLNIVAPIWQCPCAVYGPGDSALDHTPNEHVSLTEYSRAVAVLSEALRSLTGTA